MSTGIWPQHGVPLRVMPLYASFFSNLDGKCLTIACTQTLALLMRTIGILLVCFIRAMPETGLARRDPAARSAMREAPRAELLVPTSSQV